MGIVSFVLEYAILKKEEINPGIVIRFDNYNVGKNTIAVEQTTPKFSDLRQQSFVISQISSGWLT